MAAVTITDYVEQSTPDMEVVVVTPASDGDTYVSRKFSQVRGVQMTPWKWSPVASDAWGISAVSGGTITLQLVGTTNQPFTLTIFGDA